MAEGGRILLPSAVDGCLQAHEPGGDQEIMGSSGRSLRPVSAIDRLLRSLAADRLIVSQRRNGVSQSQGNRSESIGRSQRNQGRGVGIISGTGRSSWQNPWLPELPRLFLSPGHDRLLG